MIESEDEYGSASSDDDPYLSDDSFKDKKKQKS